MRRLLPWVLAFAGMAGCGEPTEVVIFVDTTLGVPCQIDQIEITVKGAGGETETRLADPAEGPQSLTVLRDGSGAAFDLTVRGLKRGVEVARSEGRQTFLDESRQSISVVLSEACTMATCNVAGGASTFTVPVASTRLDCTGVSDHYSVRTATFISAVNACDVGVNLQSFDSFGSGAELTLTDSTLLTALESFDFRFYGRKMEQLWVADDGYVSFGASAPGALANTVALGDLASAGAPDLSVVAFWDSMYVEPGVGEVCVALVGSPGEATLWITWSRLRFQQGAADDLTFSVGLEESTNDVIVSFITMNAATLQSKANGGEAAVGIRGAIEPACPTTECSSSGLCTDGTPCGYTQYFANQVQSSNWPTTLLFSPEP